MPTSKSRKKVRLLQNKKTQKKLRGGSLLSLDAEGIKIDLDKTFSNRLEFFKSVGLERERETGTTELYQVKDSLPKLDFKNSADLNGFFESGREIEYSERTKIPDKLKELGDIGLELGNYMKKTYRNITITNDLIQKNEEYIKGNTYISHIDCHGGINSMDFRVVPANTIICCMSPIDNLSYNYPKKTHAMENLKSPPNILNNITNAQYIDLFRLTNKIGKNNLGVLRKIVNNSEFYYINSFRNSSWYYPGQFYPNLDLSIGKKDLAKSPSASFEFNFIECSSDIDTNKVKNIPVTHAKYGFPFYSREELILYTNGKTPEDNPHGIDMRFKLAMLANHKRRDTSKNFKLIIVVCCRGINKHLDMSIFLRMEFINYEIVSSVTHYNTNEPKTEGINILSNYESYKQNFLKSETVGNTTLAFRQQNKILKNINYNPYIPSMIEVFNRIKKLPTNVSLDDSSYIACQRPSRIMAFIQKVYDDINDRFKNVVINNFVNKPEVNTIFKENLIKYAKYLKFSFRDKFTYDIIGHNYDEIVITLKYLCDRFKEGIELGLSPDKYHKIISEVEPIYKTYEELYRIDESMKGESLNFNFISDTKVLSKYSAELKYHSKNIILLHDIKEINDDQLKQLNYVHSRLFFLTISNTEPQDITISASRFPFSPTNHFRSVKKLVLEKITKLEIKSIGGGLLPLLSQDTSLSHIQAFMELYPYVEELILNKILEEGKKLKFNFKNFIRLKTFIMKDSLLDINDFKFASLERLFLKNNENIKIVSVSIPKNMKEIEIDNLNKTKILNLAGLSGTHSLEVLKILNMNHPLNVRIYTKFINTIVIDNSSNIKLLGNERVENIRITECFNISIGNMHIKNLLINEYAVIDIELFKNLIQRCENVLELYEISSFSLTQDIYNTLKCKRLLISEDIVRDEIKSNIKLPKYEKLRMVSE